MQKILWIGPLKFGLSGHDTVGASKLAIMLDQLSQKNCDITVVGNLTCKALTMVSSSFSMHNMAGSASVVWEILKGRKLPGLMALDRVCFLNFLASCSFHCTLLRVRLVWL